MTNLTLNLAALLKDSLVSGPGIRDAIWVQGCSIGCKGCINQHFLPHTPKKIIPVQHLLKHFKARQHKIDGCTLLGGEPMEQPEAVSELLHGIKAIGLSTIVFTGLTYKKLQQQKKYQQILDNTDLLIDGPFIAKLYQEDLYLRGSTNQKFHFLGKQWSAKTFPETNITGEIIIQGDHIRMQGIGTINLIKNSRLT